MLGAACSTIPSSQRRLTRAGFGRRARCEPRSRATPLESALRAGTGANPRDRKKPARAAGHGASGSSRARTRWPLPSAPPRSRERGRRRSTIAPRRGSRGVREALGGGRLERAMAGVGWPRGASRVGILHAERVPSSESVHRLPRDGDPSSSSASTSCTLRRNSKSGRRTLLAPRIEGRLFVFLVRSTTPTTTPPEAPRQAGMGLRVAEAQGRGAGDLLRGVQARVLGLGDSNLLLDLRATTKLLEAAVVHVAVLDRLRRSTRRPMLSCGQVDDRTGDAGARAVARCGVASPTRTMLGH